MNEQPETVEQTVTPPLAISDIPACIQSPEVHTSAVVTPQGGAVELVVVEGQ
jgi:hypothetical protein